MAPAVARVRVFRVIGIFGVRGRVVDLLSFVSWFSKCKISRRCGSEGLRVWIRFSRLGLRRRRVALACPVNVVVVEGSRGVSGDCRRR